MQQIQQTISNSVVVKLPQVIDTINFSLVTVFIKTR